MKRMRLNPHDACFFVLLFCSRPYTLSPRVRNREAICIDMCTNMYIQQGIVRENTSRCIRTHIHARARARTHTHTHTHTHVQQEIVR